MPKDWEGCPRCGESTMIANRVLVAYVDCTMQIEADGSNVAVLDGEEGIEPRRKVMGVHCANCKARWMTLQDLFREAGVI